MLIRPLSIVVACVATCFAAGCSSESSETPAAIVEAVQGVPAQVFVAQMPADAQPLVAVKETAQPGDHVTIEARIGGRREPFVEERAMFSVADPSIKTCTELHGDTCPTPWDNCCEPPDNLLKHMATIQIADGDGRPLSVSLDGEHGLAPAKTVIVVGTVDQKDEFGTFVINAESIFVKEG